MDAFDMNKISTAITYMDRIAEGRLLKIGPLRRGMAILQ